MKLSVIMTVYNTEEEYLKEAINSILSQTFEDFEFIIIDDGSTQKYIKDIILNYKDKRVKYFYKNNTGVADSLNYGLKKAKGEFIARMDSDDISLPNRFSKQIEYLEENKDISLIGSWFETFPQKQVIQTIKNPRLLDFIKKNQIAHPTVMFRKKDFDKYNLVYNLKYAAEDYELWSRAIIFLKFENLQEILLKYRISNKQVTSINSKRINEDARLIQDKLFRFLTSNAESILKKIPPKNYHNSSFWPSKNIEEFFY